MARAEANGFAELSAARGPLTLAAGLTAVSRAPLTAANTKWSPGSLRWHARLRWQATGALRLDLEGRNLTDAWVEDLRGYAAPGREVLLGFRFTP